MTRIAVTGHRGLTEEVVRFVADGIRAEVGKHAGPDLVGLSCVADGADTLFAQAVLDAGGRLVVVVPARGYREAFPVGPRSMYDSLVERASEVVQLEHVTPDSVAYMDASLRMLDRADELVAVWDGLPARGYGGTADVVAVAAERGLPVTVVWPVGVLR